MRTDVFVTLDQSRVPAREFVDRWAQAYPQSLADSYDRLVSQRRPLSRDDVQALMRWKAGTRFAGNAADYAARVPLQILNDARRIGHRLSNDEVRSLYNTITAGLTDNGRRPSSGAIVWRIFLCHVAHPADVPIYDINVWRAWGHIAGWWKPEYEGLRPSSLPTYLEYRDWANGYMDSQDISPPQFDRALMTFGQFTQTRWHKL